VDESIVNELDFVDDATSIFKYL